MIASVHLADIGPRTALSIVRKSPKPGRVDGLRHADAALAAPLRASIRPGPDLGRIGLVAFWDDDAALDRFLADDPVAVTLAGGWRVRLEPLRAFGSWPGLPDDVPTVRATAHDGPAVVLTLGRLRLTQTLRFLRTSAKAEGAVGGAPGLIWATGLGRPRSSGRARCGRRRRRCRPTPTGSATRRIPRRSPPTRPRRSTTSPRSSASGPTTRAVTSTGATPLPRIGWQAPRARPVRRSPRPLLVERCRERGFDGATWSDAGAILAIGGLPARFTAATDGLADRGAHGRPVADRWSIAEYVDHVRETLFGMRFVLSIALDAPGTDLGDPPVSRFEPEPRVLDLPAALDGLRAQAEQLHSQLRGFATPDWDATVVVGADTVDVHWIARHAVHDATHHLGDIERLRTVL